MTDWFLTVNAQYENMKTKRQQFFIFFYKTEKKVWLKSDKWKSSEMKFNLKQQQQINFIPDIPAGPKRKLLKGLIQCW